MEHEIVVKESADMLMGSQTSKNDGILIRLTLIQLIFVLC